MNRLSRLRSRGADEQRFGFPDLLAQMNAVTSGGGVLAPSSLTTTYGKQTFEPIGNSFTGYVQAAYKSDGIVFACVLARLLLFSDVRFQFQTVIPRPGDLYGTTALKVLEQPWPGATTGDLLARMEQHASLAGNAYVFRAGGTADRVKVLRPDWLTIIHGSRSGDPEASWDDLDAELLGYTYQPGGPASGRKPITLMPNEVAHYAPIPDPEATFRGMSWITPVLPEVTADKAATTHKAKFFEHGATPNMVIKYDPTVSPEQVREYAALMAQNNAGTVNAYKTLHLGGGADPMVVGKDFQQLDFKATQGAGETRIAAAAGVPPIVVGLSEGLDASTYSNYGQARRKFADGWARPAWRSVSGALAQIIQTPADSRLWYDASDVSFLQEDEADQANIVAQQAQTIRQLVDAGFSSDAVVKAVQAGDLSSLVGQHSGLYSVQLQAPGASPAG